MSRPSLAVLIPEQLKELWEVRAGRVLRRVGLDSVRTTIFTLAVVATLIPALATSWISYRQNLRTIEARYHNQLRSATEQGTREVNLWLKGRLYDLRVFAASYEVTENIGRTGSRRLPDYLHSIDERFRDLDDLMVVSPDRRTVAASQPNAPPLQLDGDWMQRARDGEPVFGAPQRSDTTRVARMEIAVPIINAAGRFLGVFAARLNFAGTMHPLRQLVAESEGRLSLVRSDGDAIFAIAGAPGILPAATMRRLADANGATVNYDAADGVAVIGVSRPVPQTEWTLVAEVPAATAYADIRRLRTTTILLVVVLLLGVGSLAYALGLLIVLPLERLSAAAKLVAGGNLDVDVPASGGGEVAELSAAFNEMVRRLRQGRAELERLSVTDELTGLANRRRLTAELARELVRSERHSRTFAVLMLDVDRFKVFNDTHGHPAGDAVLQQLAQVLRDSTREVDTVARYGGEEFLLVLPETTAAAAKQMADRIRSVTEDHKFTLAEGNATVSVTVSIGYAMYPKHAETAEGLIEAADDALYRSKQGGRNRVTAAG